MQVARVFGTRIAVSEASLALIALTAYLGYGREAGVAAACVGLHECAHAVVARAFDAAPEQVTLYPFGGVARLPKLIELYPEAESTIALAGPLTSGLAALSLWAALGHNLLAPEVGASALRDNLLLCLFNALPLLPLDGGRIVRAALAKRIGFVEGTRRLALVSMVLAALGIAAAVPLYLGGIPSLGLAVALGLVLLGALQERRRAGVAIMRYMIRRREVLRDVGILQVEHVLVLDTVEARRLVRSITPRRYKIYLLSSDGIETSRRLTEDQLVEAVLTIGPQLTVGEIWERRGGHSPGDAET